MIHGKQPLVKHFKSSGPRAFVYAPAEVGKGKLEVSRSMGILVEYRKWNTYSILLDESNKVVETGDVTFIECKTLEVRTKQKYIEFETIGEDTLPQNLENNDTNETDIVETARLMKRVHKSMTSGMNEAQILKPIMMNKNEMDDLDLNRIVTTKFF